MKEMFKDIAGYEGLYKVSNLGRVKSVRRNIILKPSTKKNYKYVNLYKDNSAKTYQVHRLVAIAFIPNPNNLPIINHKDEDPSNNTVENLEWCTHSYNINYGTAMQRLSEYRKGKNFGLVGENAPMYGKKHSTEAKQKISNSLKGEKNPFNGKTHSEETKQKISNSLKGLSSGGKNPAAKKVLCITTGEVFDCIKDASEKYSLNHSSLCKCCKGVYKSCGGMKWRYK